ncbi:MAG TPA: 3-methyl-2-oxobutanoate dehydrogenase subunit VorB [bacterium]|nr:3-methyl-2-oxobutanoate dehydrogenase subunit VorB [bacterium]HOL65855.1 3-methyl-2-oxobutanoate dehydrogenase subunit VorB [bacterium]HPP11095.1 3-methyl-2-oxobutanoate dehydrogenase subunit VorB [bacterium]
MKSLLLNGCEAAAEAAIAAGCRFYAGYPITPQNRFPEYMSFRLPQSGGVFLQAESELAAINMVFGAAAAGARALTSSSSPGISLKQEGISYLAGCELPAVIINMNRAGPGLGDVTPSQSDYFQSTRGGGHGDYRTIVLAPWSVQEIYDFTYLAFDLADRYRNPVLILSDGMVAQLLEPVHPRNGMKKLPQKKWALTGCRGRKPNSIKSLFLTPGVLETHNWKLARKYERMEKREVRWESYLCEKMELLIVSFGICARIAREAMEQARREGLRVGLFRPITLWPFPYRQLKSCLEKVSKVLVVELNLGQMLDDVKIASGGHSRIFFYGRPGGGVPTPEEILKEIKKK